MQLSVHCYYYSIQDNTYIKYIIGNGKLCTSSTKCSSRREGIAINTRMNLNSEIRGLRFVS